MTAWSVLAILLLIPLIATLLTDEVNWRVGDFAVAAVLLATVGGLMDFTVRNACSPAYRWAVGVALAAAFLLVWVNGAVGIIRADDNDINLLYGGVLAVGVVGALVSRLRPAGMALAMAAAALAQTSVAVGALVAGAGGAASGPFGIVAVNGGFVALWIVAAALFRRAVHRRSQG